MKKNFILIIAIIAVAVLLSREERATYVLITIDTEKDLAPFLETYRGIEEGVPKLLDMFRNHGVKATFFVTGDVAEKYPEQILSIKGMGHEIGGHGLNHEDFNNLSYNEKEMAVELGTRILENLTSGKVVSFRAPYHSANTELINILESNGYLVEASATPRLSYPYSPSKTNWLEEGDMKLLRVPVSLTPSLFYPSSIYDRSWTDAYESAIQSERGKWVKIVVIGLHPWEMVDIHSEGHEEYTRAAGNYTYSSLSNLLKYLKNKNVRYITMRELYDLMRAG